jgi:hypothetical protein
MLAVRFLGMSLVSPSVRIMRRSDEERQEEKERGTDVPRRKSVVEASI